MLKLLFFQKNGKKSKHFLAILHHFTILQSVGKQEQSIFFRLLDKKLYITRKICYLVCECGKDYIGETKRNTTKSWLANDNLTEDSEPAR